LSSLDAALQLFPGDADDTSLVSMEFLWQSLSSFRSFISPHEATFSKAQKDHLILLTDDSIARIGNLITYCDQQLQELDQRYSLEITLGSDEDKPEPKRATKKSKTH
jgi:hypothetical protein